MEKLSKQVMNIRGHCQLKDKIKDSKIVFKHRIKALVVKIDKLDQKR
jgi:hypothetical protein